MNREVVFCVVDALDGFSSGNIPALPSTMVTSVLFPQERRRSAPHKILTNLYLIVIFLNPLVL